jgi:hypothetical protein
MKKMLVLGALVLGLAFAGGTIANAQCYPAPVATFRCAPYYGYHYYPRHRIVRQAYLRPAYHYGYRPYAPRPRVAIGVGF